MVTTLYTVGKVLRLAACGVALLGSATIAASAAPGGTFVAEPEADQPADMIHGGYFQLALASGQQRSVRVMVQNTSDEPMTIRAYPVDGIAMSGGGIDFTTFSQPIAGTGTWVSIDTPTLELAPGEARRLTATVAAAANATAGDHVAGIAVEDSRPHASDTDSQVVIQVYYRKAIAVVVAVPGERAAALEVDAVALTQDAGGGSRAVVQVRNTGNSLQKAKGTLEIAGNQASGTAQTFSVDTLIPTTHTGVAIPLPGVRLAKGTYNVHVILLAEDGHTLADWQGTAAFPALAEAAPTPVPARDVSLVPLDAPVDALPAAAVATVTDQVAPAGAPVTLSDQDAAAIARQAKTNSAGFWLLGILAVLLIGLRVVFGIVVRRRRKAE